MATQVQNRRGTTAEHSTFTGAVGELTVDTTKDTVVVHDGAVAGGRPLLREDQSNLPTSAPTTGIYNASGSLAISTGGSGRLFINSSGQVGVGVSPSAPLEVNGEARFTRLGVASQYVGIIGDGADTRIIAEGSSKNLTIKNNSTTSSAIIFDQAVASSYIFNQAGTERLRITSTGTVNIVGAGSAGSTQAVSFNGSAPVNSLVIDSSGRLLVGTSTSRVVEDLLGNGPQGLIQIETTNSDAIMSIISAGTADAGRAGTLSLGRHRNSTVGGTPTIVQDGDTLGAICFAGGDGTDMRTKGASIAAQVDGSPGVDDMPGRLVFSTTADGASSPTERMRIRENGKIWINTASNIRGNREQFVVKATGTGEAIHVESNGLTYAGYTYRDADSGAGTHYIGYWENSSGTNVGAITHNNTNTTYATTSDYRLKENVEPIVGACDRLNQLKPCRFNFIADPDNIIDGFLAHEAQAVVPESVIGQKDAVNEDGSVKPQGIDQSKLVPLLTAALQEAIGEIESLKARVAALESA